MDHFQPMSAIFQRHQTPAAYLLTPVACPWCVNAARQLSEFADFVACMAGGLPGQGMRSSQIQVRCG